MFNKYDLKVWTPTLDLITTWMCVVIIFPCIFQSLKESCSWKKKIINLSYFLYSFAQFTQKFWSQ